MDNSEQNTQAHYFEFDTDYILRGNLPVEKPYEKYFEKKVKK